MLLQMPPRRPLDTEDAKLWAQVVRSVKPMRGGAKNAPSPLIVRRPEPAEGSFFLERLKRNTTAQPMQADEAALKPSLKPNPANTLDTNWDKRLSKGAIRPDYIIDLHEHTAASAHARLDQGLSAAIAQGARVVLLITGKARGPENPRLPPTTRGVIRASVPDWLTGSLWNGHIAAIRNAHPRHGGAGALYLIMRRPR